jgi:hypothetical protein
MGNAVKDETRTGPSNQHMARLSRGRVTDPTDQGPDHSSKKLKFNFEYNNLTDLMFVDLAPVEAGARVEVYEIGDNVGFPGQIQVRVNVEREIVYGLTIQNFTGFKRKLLWRYRMWSIQSALQFLVSILLAGLNLDRSSHRRSLPC